MCYSSSSGTSNSGRDIDEDEGREKGPQPKLWQRPDTVRCQNSSEPVPEHRCEVPHDFHLSLFDIGILDEKLLDLTPCDPSQMMSGSSYCSDRDKHLLRTELTRTERRSSASMCGQKSSEMQRCFALFGCTGIRKLSDIREMLEFESRVIFARCGVRLPVSIRLRHEENAATLQHLRFSRISRESVKGGGVAILFIDHEICGLLCHLIRTGFAFKR